jgi:hypothetical protein
MVTAYTVSNLRPSDDAVNFPVAGTLWEDTTTVDAVQGTVTPANPFFNARADNGQNYRALYRLWRQRALAERRCHRAQSPPGRSTSM